jgi:transcriptional regulator with XRE-family HTH domain
MAYIKPRTLKLARQAMGLSLRDVSRVTGVPVTTIHAAEQGTRRIQPWLLNKLLPVYGFDVADFQEKELA